MAAIAALIAATLAVRAVTGDVASPAEESAWAEAKAQHSGDGLRAYLRTYPPAATTTRHARGSPGCRIGRPIATRSRSGLDPLPRSTDASHELG